MGPTHQTLCIVSVVCFYFGELGWFGSFSTTQDSLRAL